MRICSDAVNRADMDEIAEYNRARWEELAKANVMYSRPWLDLDETSARTAIDTEGLLGTVAGKNVLCLAGGGGQQSAAFALLGRLAGDTDLMGAIVFLASDASAYITAANIPMEGGYTAR